MVKPCFRHAISLLVHERWDVVVDQCRNFETFAPDSLVMVHVSRSAVAARPDLVAALAAAGCTRCVVNDVSVASRWGSIIGGHFANIRALDPLLDDGGSVSLHSSNDMLLRRLPNVAGPRGAHYETRPITRATVWHTGRQYASSAALPALLERLDARQAFGSQIEGSAYPFALLRDLAEAMADADDLLAALPPIAEEIVFPTWAAARLETGGREPYVLFRQTLLPAAGMRLTPAGLRATRFGDVVHRGLNRIGSRWSSPNASMADVDAVAAGRPLAVAVWAQGAPPRPAMPYYGIKRVARILDDPIRVRIRRHTESAASLPVSEEASQS